jgi:hypothetical protein
MTLLEEKNLQKGEAVIYNPKLHWIILVRPVIYVFVSVILLMILKSFVFSYTSGIKWIPGIWISGIVNNHFKAIMMVNVLLAAICLIRCIVEYCVVEYYITNKRLILKKGVFTSKLIDIPIEKVEGLICVRGLFGYFFNYGTVFVSGIGRMLSRYGSIRKPYKVRRIIYDVIDRSKNLTIIREELPKPVFVKTERQPEIHYGSFVTSYPAGKREVLVK